MDSDHTTTANYQLNAARLLAASVSPSLAALYVTNARRSTSEKDAHTLSPLHCPRCAHLPVSTRIIANVPKQRRTSSTKNARGEHDNKATSAQTRKCTSSRLNSRTTRGRRLRIVKSCARCGYVGAAASERSTSTSDYYENVNERALSSRASPSSSLVTPRLGSPCPAMNVDLETETQQHDRDIVETSAKLKGKPHFHSEPGAVVPPSTSTLTPIPASQPSVSSSSSSKTLLSQSGSAAKRQKKKKVGLQEMLARSKEQKEKNAKQDGSGLAAFLSGL